MIEFVKNEFKNSISMEEEEDVFWFKGCRIQKTYELYENNGIEDVLNDNRNYFVGTWFKVVRGEGTKYYKHTHFRYNELGEIEGFLVYPIKRNGDVIGYEYNKLLNPFTYFSPLVVETLYNNSILEYEPMYGSGYILLTSEGKMINEQYHEIFKCHQSYEDNYKAYKKYLELFNKTLDLCLEKEPLEDEIFNELFILDNLVIKYRSKWMKNLEEKNIAIEKTRGLIIKFKKKELLRKMYLE